MKPIRLTLKNIGPFLDEEIDFSQLDTLFLISGNTGAGKTFIFDAMTFALYGKLKGSRANFEQELRSKYAQDGSESYVEFIFETAAKKYRVHRTVPYTYTNRNGKAAKKLSEVDFSHFSDGGFVSYGEKTEAANARIQSVIGLAADEFAQVVLLPQGAFAEFLRQNSKERRDTLVKLFPVSAFSSIMQRAREKAKELEDELTAIARQIELSSKSDDFSTAESRIEEMKSQISALRAQEERLIEKRTVLASKRASLEEKYTAAEKAESDRKKLSRLLEQKNQFEQLEKHLEKASRALELAVFIHKSADAEKRFASAKEALAAAKVRRAAADDELAGLSAQKERIVLLKEHLELRKKNIAQLKARLEDAQQFTLPDVVPPEMRADVIRMKNTCAGKTAGFADAESGGDAENQYGSISSELSEVCALLGKAAERDRLKLLLDEKNTVLETLRSASDRISSLLERNRCSRVQAENALEKQRILNMAAAVAKTLEGGKPCPVCGSCAHPAPAEEEQSLLSLEQQVQTFRMNEEQQEKEFQQNMQEIRLAEASRETLSVQLESLSSVPETAAVQKKYLLLLENYCTGSSYILSVQKEIAAAENEIAQFNLSFQEAEKTAAGAQADFDNASAFFVSCEGERTTSAEELSQKIASSVFSDADEARSYLMESSELKIQQDRCRRYSNEVSALERLVENAAEENSLPDLKAELAAVLSSEKQVQADFAAVKQNLAAAERAFTEYSSAFSAFTALQTQFEEKSAAFKPYKKLSDDLNGANPAKLQFDSWALGMYFEQVVEYASCRFFDISNGRFRFVLDTAGKQGKGYKGLDVLVADSFTGCTRDPATLSGGETFEASISLALAITDVVQNQNGAMPLDALFIDEGFGTLDGETLDKAMEILTELQETKMIGVISHVESMKQTIRSRIEVEKTNFGSHIKIR